ncbi:zinc finger protein [Stylosanthes scabra]|uniref:Zinc finger protein n=1 Tax=Stylosanthes scabra TaxID=79078 RepID=A0ABU6Q918_9FABA|nr:zinc finger protein [Stylosanthes scabra]
MCKGAEEKEHGGDFCRSLFTHEEEEEGASSSQHGGLKSCELCGVEAFLYCHADDAYLCRECDKWVHKANFLALRHIRCFLCNTCHNLTRRCLIGASMEIILPPTLIENIPNNTTNNNCSRTQDPPFKFI